MGEVPVSRNGAYRPLPHHLGILAGFLGVALLAVLQIPMTSERGGVFDYWPLYYGAKAWIATGDAYWFDPTLPNLGQLSQVGNAYPIHAVLLLGLPLAWASPTAAGVIWVLVVGLAWLGAIAWARESWYWLLWLPMWDALRMQQPSAAVTVAAIVALGSIRREARWPFLASLVALSVKPQQTIFLLILFAWMGRRWWRAQLATAALAVSVSVVAQPDWVGQWMAQIANRSLVVEGERWLLVWLVPLGIWLALRGWQVTAAAVMSTAVGPWPELAYYTTSAWPLGLDRQRGAMMALAGLIAATAVLCCGFWAYPFVLLPTLALFALFTPRRSAGGALPPA